MVYWPTVLLGTSFYIIVYDLILQSLCFGLSTMPIKYFSHFLYCTISHLPNLDQDHQSTDQRQGSFINCQAQVQVKENQSQIKKRATADANIQKHPSTPKLRIEFFFIDQTSGILQMFLKHFLPLKTSQLELDSEVAITRSI